MLTALPAAQLGSQADDRAPQKREPGVRIQQSGWQSGLADQHADRGGARPRAAAFSASSSPSSCAEPMRPMFRDPRREDHTIRTAIAPDEVFTVRRYATRRACESRPRRKPAASSRQNYRSQRHDRVDPATVINARPTPTDPRLHRATSSGYNCS